MPVHMCMTRHPQVAGARYVTYKRPHVMCRCVAWLTRSSLDDFADDSTIVDACHAGQSQSSRCILCGKTRGEERRGDEVRK